MYISACTCVLLPFVKFNMMLNYILGYQTRNSQVQKSAARSVFERLGCVSPTGSRLFIIISESLLKFPKPSL